MIGLKPITPKNMGSMFKALPEAVKRGMDDAALAVKADLEQTVKTWEHPAEFTITETSEYDRAVGTDDEVWKMLDEGTKPHLITPHGRYLRFSPGSLPKTRPGVLTSGGGRPGSGVIYARKVQHPGTKARNWTAIVNKKWARGVQPFIRDAIEKALP